VGCAKLLAALAAAAFAARRATRAARAWGKGRWGSAPPELLRAAAVARRGAPWVLAVGMVASNYELVRSRQASLYD
jgi:hypothetical protein